MKKTALAIVIVLSLLASMMSGSMLAYFVCANPFPTDPVISIEAPVDKTYAVNSIVLNITIVTRYDGYYFNSTRRVSYSLDGDTKAAVAEIDYSFDEEEKASTFNGSAVLSELTEGPHTLTVFAEYDYDVKIIQSHKSINFTIGTRPDSSVDPDTNSQTYLTITIKPDGSVEPETNLLQRDNNTYTFKGDIFGDIMVQKDGIIIDGAGYTLHGRESIYERGVYLVGPDRSHASCKNILVKNLKISNFHTGIFVVGGSNNMIIGTYLDNSGIHLAGNANYAGNVIKHNTFLNATIFVDYNRGGIDVITENNFYNGWIMVGLSDAPRVSKNYWSDYTTKYPDAKEVNNSGIWDTPYFICEVENSISLMDHQPLVNPVTDFEIPHFSNPNATPTPTPTLEPTQTPEPHQPEHFPTVPVLAFLASVAVVAVGLVICFKKRRGEAESK